MPGDSIARRGNGVAGLFGICRIDCLRSSFLSGTDFDLSGFFNLQGGKEINSDCTRKNNSALNGRAKNRQRGKYNAQRTDPPIHNEKKAE